MPKKNEARQQLRLIADPANQAALEDVGRRIVSDERVKARFVEDPSAVLRDAGINVGDVDLSDRGRALLRLVADSNIKEIYDSHDVDELNKYLVENYGDLIHAGGPVEGAVESDFHVVAEAEVIAVGVAAVAAAVVAIASLERQIGQINELQRIETTLHARINAIEERVRAVEEGNR